MTTDFELQRNVLEELAFEPSVNAAEIGVLVENGVVVLNGTVKTLNEKWAAEHAAKRVKGVVALTDELTVKPAHDNWRSDADIARAALNALDWNTALPRNHIQVMVEHGWVTLDGTVDFHFQKEVAEATVRYLRGVRGVFNLLTLEPRTSTADINMQVESALGRAAHKNASRIRVITTGNTITLKGEVKTWTERNEAERAAWAAPGVEHVRNELRIVSVIV